MNNFVYMTHWIPGGTLVHKEFKLCSVSCTISLVVKNTPIGPRFESDRDQFFSDGIYSGSKNFRSIIYLLVFSAL